MLDLLHRQGIKVVAHTYISILQGCVISKDLAEGKNVHNRILQSSYKPDIYLENTLLYMYVICGSIADARQMFDRMHERNSWSCSSMISLYGNHGHAEEALKLFWQMEQEGIDLDEITAMRVVKLCASLGALGQGKHVHLHIIQIGLESNPFVATALVDMYIKCGSMEHALQIFNDMPRKDVVAWTSVIAGFVSLGHDREALKLFWKMQREGVKPNLISFTYVIKACSRLKSLLSGKQIHARAVENGYISHAFVVSSLVKMYIECGDVKCAKRVFDRVQERNVVLWTAMISGYVQLGHAETALKLFWKMEQEDVKPNEVTFVRALSACCILQDLEQGKQIHAQIIKDGFESESSVGNSLTDMYVQCKSIEDARQVFEKIAKRNIVSWNAMIKGYVKQGYAEQALKLFRQMRQDDVKPNYLTFVSILNACGNLGNLEHGKDIHAQIIMNGLETDVLVSNSLIGMYAKCGNEELAYQVFNKMPHRDVVSWTALIGGLAKSGCGKQALKYFWKMEQEGMNANGITILSALGACTCPADLEQGKDLHAYIIKNGFESLSSVMNALIDMYSRCGSINHARQVFDSISERTVFSWTAMIAGYVKQDCPKEALTLFQQLKQEGIDPNEFTFVSALRACAILPDLGQGKEIHAQITKSRLESSRLVRNALVHMYAKNGCNDYTHLSFQKAHK